MFLDFYRLKEQPFAVTPDPAYLYSSRTHAEALASLSLGIKENRGFLALIAEPGMGKTTLLYRLLEELRDSSKTVLVSQTQCDSREFVEYILHDLGVNPQGMSFVAMHGRLNEILFEELLAGKRFVLVVDEAQNLEDSVLETIRMLSNFETHNTKLLQIVLAGQPRLASVLAQPRLAQLRQRIAVLSHLKPLVAEETGRYINHRLKVAGYAGDPLFEPLFSPNAVGLIAQRSQGIPRNINNLCFNSMLLASSRGLQMVTAPIVQEAANRLDVRLLALEPTAYADSAADPEQVVLPTKGPERTSPPITSSVLQEQHPSTVPGFRSDLTYSEEKQPGRSKWLLRSAVVAGIFVSALSIPSVVDFLASRVDQGLAGIQGSGSAHAEAKQTANDHPASAPANYDAAPEDTAAGQVLTVIAGPQQTIKDLSLRYAGHYDDNLFQEISRLNPDLRDLNHLEAGQLIRIPLPPGAMKKVNDVGDDPGNSQSQPPRPEGFFSKLSSLFRGRR